MKKTNAIGTLLVTGALCASVSMGFLSTSALAAESAESDATQENAATSRDTSGDQAIFDMIGAYVDGGYENTGFNFKITLPDTYTLQSRSTIHGHNADPVEESNTDSVYNYYRSQIFLEESTVFKAYAADGIAGIEVSLQSLAPLHEISDDPQVVESQMAQDELTDLETNWQNTLEEEGHEVSDVQVSAFQGEIAGAEHPGVNCSLNLDGTTIYLRDYYISSDDGERVACITVSSTDPAELDELASYVQSLSEDGTATPAGSTAADSRD